MERNFVASESSEREFWRVIRRVSGCCVDKSTTNRYKRFQELQKPVLAWPRPCATVGTSARLGRSFPFVWNVLAGDGGSGVANSAGRFLQIIRNKCSGETSSSPSAEEI